MEQIKYTTSFPSNKYPESGQDTTRAIICSISWYFRREWRRYLGAVALLVLSRCCNWFRQKWLVLLSMACRTTLYYRADPDVDRHHGADSVVVYLLRYVWRILLFGASYNWLSNCVKIITVS